MTTGDPSHPQGDGPQFGRGLLAVISGPSGVGKGTVLRHVLERVPSAVVSISVTTRPPRPNESEGADYRFISDDDFTAMVADDLLLEWAPYAGSRYGTPAAWVDEQRASGRTVLLEIEVQGAIQIRERVPEALLIFLAPPSFDVLAQRLVGRDTESDARIAKRLDIAREEVAQASRFDHVVVNGDLDACVDEVVALLTAPTPN